MRTVTATGDRPWRRRWVALWMGLVLLAVLVPAFGGVDGPWPFVRWTMFSQPGPVESDAITVVTINEDGDEQVYEDPVLPGGFVRDLYQPRWSSLDAAGREADCQRMRTALDQRGLAAVRIELWTWTLLDRSGDRPANVEREVLFRC